MGIDLGKLFSDAAKGVTDFIDKTSKDITKAIDQNNDGKLDLSDIQLMMDKVQADRAGAQRKADLERLKPLFPDDFERADFSLPKMIRVDAMDKPHAESAVCSGSAGFRTVLDDLTVITIYRGFIDRFGLSFYPELENGVYYADPCDKARYISLDDYFVYMKKQRVAELQRLAQSLGAKHFKVTYKERNSSVTSGSTDASIGAKAQGANVQAKVSHSVSNSSLSTIGIEAEMTFPGHPPVKPDPRYLKKEIEIINLINMRMDPLSPLQHQRFQIEMSNSSGIRINDAVKIDAALKAMKISSHTAVASQAQTEARRILEYEIDF